MIGTGICLPDCTRGYYHANLEKKTCSTCDPLCKECEGNAKNCTRCWEKEEKPLLDRAFLFRPKDVDGTCIVECPLGYTSVGGECFPCASPCATCTGTVNTCTSCDGTLDRIILYRQNCLRACPAGSVTFAKSANELSCLECADQAGCEICDDSNIEKCLRCNNPLVLHEGICLGACPGGYKYNSEKTACIAQTIDDIGILPFPWLIIAFFGCLIALFGKCKKKPGRTKYISTQNTITCFIVIIAFVQFCALCALIVWAFLFGVKLLLLAALILLGVLMLLNFIFQIFYSYTFNRMITPADKLRKYKEKSINKAELRQFTKPSDEHFRTYVKKHAYWSCLVAFFSFFCTFKCNKAYYSRFYSFDMFKARWSLGKYYRKSMTCFCIVSMIIDGLIICVCIAALITMTVFSNMLWVTVVEVAVLSLLLIIFGCIELFLLKEYLSYNEASKASWGQTNTRQKFDVSSANDFLDKESREVMMKNLLRNVKTNQDMFLNNKLDDLLNMFGDRYCKSMMELGTGWDKENDPRRCITWPLTPTKIAEYDGEYKFTKDDMIGGFEDNVYAEAKKVDPKFDAAVQGDQP